MWGGMAPPGSFAVMKEGNPEESSAWGGGGGQNDMALA